MLLKSSYLIICLVVIKFSAVIRADLTRRDTVIAEETLTYLQYVNEHWRDLSFKNQMEIIHLHEVIVMNARAANAIPVTEHQLIDKHQIILPSVRCLWSYLTMVVWHHKNTRSYDQLSAVDKRIIAEELQQLNEAKKEIDIKYTLIRQHYWQYIPDHVKNKIEQCRLKIENIERAAVPPNSLNSITYRDIVAYRRDILHLTVEQKRNLNEALINLDRLRQQGQAVPIPRLTEYQEQSKGLKRTYEQESRQQVNKRKIG